MTRMSISERRARLGVRHLLSKSSPDPVEVVQSLVVVHATDPASVYLGIAARMSTADVDAISRSLYEDRSLVRMLGMRRTMFIAPTSIVPIIQASSTDAVAIAERKRLLAILADNDVASDVDSWLATAEQAALQAVVARGEAAAAEIGAAEPLLRTKITMARGKSYETRQNVVGRILTLLAAEGFIVRTRPGGSWTSSQYRWATFESWLSKVPPKVSVEVAQAQLVQAWLQRFGPGTLEDLKWWTGWTMKEVKRALSTIDTVEVYLDGLTGLVLADDVDPVKPPAPWVALLPALDSSPMGWFQRDWYLSQTCRQALFDRNGNIGPSVWCDGRIVGGWGQRKDGSIAYRLLEDVGTTAAAAIETEASRLANWHGEVRVTPRFPTPLQKELII